MTAQFAANPALSLENSQSSLPSAYAVEVYAEHSAEALLRVLNPLQKLDITPHSVRSGKSWSGGGMFVEIQFEASAPRARQICQQIQASILVERVELMACSL